jgi:hypothetical protein
VLKVLRGQSAPRVTSELKELLVSKVLRVPSDRKVHKVHKEA